MAIVSDIESLCRLGMMHLQQGDPVRAKRMLFRAWQAMPGVAGLAAMLSQAHKAEAVLRQAQQGCNGKILFVIRGYFFSYYMPLLRCLPADRIDLDTGDDDWGVDTEAHHEARSLGYVPGVRVPHSEWWRYAMVVADHAIQMHFPIEGPEALLPPVVVYLPHTTAYTGDAVHPYQSHCIYPFEALALQQQVQAPWQRCLFTGPYQFDAQDLHLMHNERGVLRRQVMEALGLEDRGGPLVVCYSSSLDSHVEVAQGVRGLAAMLHSRGGVVVLKPFPDDGERYAAQDMGHALVWRRAGAGGNMLRLAADCVLCGVAGSTLLSVFLTGQRVLPYHTEMEREYCEGNRDRWRLHPRGTVKPDANPLGRAIIAACGGSSSIADTAALHVRLGALLADATYHARNEDIRLRILGRSDTMQGARQTAAVLDELWQQAMGERIARR